MTGRRIRPTFDTSTLSADEAADRITQWIQWLLADSASSGTAIAVEEA